VTVTTKGFQGTLSDVDLATQFPHHAPTVYSATDCLVSAVNGARTVSIAPGSSIGGFIKRTSDAAETIALAPPTSGGKWFAITVDRQWSPTSTATLKGDDLAQTTDGTIPTIVPLAVYNAAAALPNQPGSAGSTAGQRQILALVHVRAADSTLTIFDMRLQATKSGTIAVSTLHALRWASLILNDGAHVTVQQHNLPSGALHVSSSWQKRGVSFLLAGLLYADSTGISGNGSPAANDVLALATAGGNLLSVFQDAPAIWDARDKLVYAWTGTDDYTFRPMFSRRTKFLAQLNGARTINPATWTDVEWDTIIKDPSGMNNNTPAANHWVRLPWRGLYRLFVSAALNGGDDAGQIVRFQWVTPNGYIIGQVAQYGLVSDYAQQSTAFFNLDLDPTDPNFPNYGYVKPQIFHNPNGGARQFSYGADSARARVEIEYLGL
jgi:hypothetical protein